MSSSNTYTSPSTFSMLSSSSNECNFFTRQHSINPSFINSSHSFIVSIANIPFTIVVNRSYLSPILFTHNCYSRITHHTVAQSS